MELFTQDSPEPNRRLVLQDTDGDYWWYVAAPDGKSGWQFSSSRVDVGKTNYPTGRRSWIQAASSYGPFTVCGALKEDGAVVAVHEVIGLSLQDSGARTEYPGGGVRDSSEGKPRFDLLWPVGVPYESQFLTRVAKILELGAKKYAERNWELFHTPEAVDHAKASLGRHYASFMSGATDEDHLALMGCNLLFLATIGWKIENGWQPPQKEDES